MSQARSFTIELTQVGTGKKATVRVNQAGFTPQYIFNWKDNANPIMRISATADGIVTSPYLISTKTALSSTRPIVDVNYTTTTNNDSIIDVLHTHSDNIDVRLLSNTTYSTRSVTITLTQKESGKTLTLIVTQAAKADDGVFKADPTALSFGPASDTKSSKITSTSKGQTVGWTVSNKSSMPSWLTISGEGTGTLSANVKDNA